MLVTVNCSTTVGYNFPFYICIVVQIHAIKLLIFKNFSYLYSFVNYSCLSLFQDEHFKLRHVEGMGYWHKMSQNLRSCPHGSVLDSMLFNYIIGKLKEKKKRSGMRNTSAGNKWRRTSNSQESRV